MVRKKMSEKTETAVLVMSRRRCCVCFGLNRDIELKAGQIAHLDGHPNNNAIDNLAFMCFEHHDYYDSRTSQSKGLSKSEVKQFREELYEIIINALKQPIEFGVVKIRLEEDVSGHYVREGEFESAEIKVSNLPDGNLQISGLALWGKTQKRGPNIGELDFEAELRNNKVTFSDDKYSGKEYHLELAFQENRLVATEKNIIGVFGMNVSFGGEYKRID